MANKEDWKCPICQGELIKSSSSPGESVKVCKECNSSWFILLCKLGKKKE